MRDDVNSLGQPIGFPVDGWLPARLPPVEPMSGRWCSLVPLVPDRHAAALHKVNSQDVDGRMWTYLPYGPFADVGAYRTWMDETCLGTDPLFFAVLTGQAALPVGVASFMRVDAANGSVEIGHIAFSPALQRTTAATEALVLMIGRVFACGNRRCEWKCNALNEPSRRAALRLGFTYEGTFRQAGVVKGRNRDTAWFSILDTEWSALKKAYDQWLDPRNFDGDGQQRLRLSDLARAVRQA